MTNKSPTKDLIQKNTSQNNTKKTDVISAAC